MKNRNLGCVIVARIVMYGELFKMSGGSKRQWQSAHGLKRNQLEQYMDLGVN
jgi:hypothetical protein